MPISQLNENQVRAVVALEWLLDLDDESRRSGRTLAIAISIIRTACSNPGRGVALIDHHDNTEEARNSMRRTIEMLLQNDRRFEYHFDRINRGFVVTSGRVGATLDWWPLGMTPPAIRRLTTEPPTHLRRSREAMGEVVRKKRIPKPKKPVSKWTHLGKL